MTSHVVLAEFRTHWLPNATTQGLARLIELLDSASPLLIRGAFTRAIPMGCLASHIAWNHPATQAWDHEAGALWLTRVARLNPATSAVIRAWDDAPEGDCQLRAALLEACRQEYQRRTQPSPTPPTPAPAALAIC